MRSTCSFHCKLTCPCKNRRSTTSSLRALRSANRGCEKYISAPTLCSLRLILEQASTTEDSTHATCRVPEIAMINCHYMWAGCFSRTVCAKLMNMGDMPDSPKLRHKRTCISFEIAPTRPHACTANDWDPCINAGKCLCISC